MRKKSVKVTALGLILFCICLSADVAYGLGGGGHRGDGRWDVPQPAAPANSNPGSSDGRQQAAAGPASSSPSGGQQAAAVSSWSFGAGFECVMIDIVRQEPLTVPEPIAALLLGLGVIGLASVRRRFNK